MTRLRMFFSERWRSGELPALLCVLSLGTLIYSHTLYVPWYLDDTPAILEHQSVHRWQDAVADFFSGRGITSLTFALNYRLHGTELPGYHLVNIAIHLAASSLVFLLLKRVFRDRLLLSLAGALIFVAHPLQTQAVTYVVQRTTSLAAFFFFLSMYLYVLARESEGDPEEKRARHWLLYGAALVAGAMAVTTKQNTAVLPAALLLFDRFFLPRGQRSEWRRLLPYLAPFCLVPVLLAVKSLLLPTLVGGVGMEQVSGMPDLSHLKHNSPLNYLVTQFSVLWLYLRMLFLPYGQALDYDFPVVAAIWQWRNLVAFLGLVLLLAVAALLRRRQPVIAAGIFWFFLALAVESSIIPLDPVFEHRLYLPMFGFALVVVSLIARLPQRALLPAVVLVATVLSVLTWQRNALWGDPMAFYQDNLRRAPRSERVHLDLGNIYLKQGRPVEAQALLERALQINPNYAVIHINLSRAYAAQNQYQKALDILLEGVRREPFRYKLYHNIGVLYNAVGRHDLAAQYLSTAARMEPGNAKVHFHLGVAYDRLGATGQAIDSFRRSSELDGSDPAVRFNLGLALHSKGDREGALREFLEAARLNPTDVGTLFNTAVLYLELGEVQLARDLAARLQQLQPAAAMQLRERIAKVGG